MKNLYSLEEVHQYGEDVRLAELQFREATRAGDNTAMKQLKDQLQIMREVLTRMHESLASHGAYRPTLLARWLAAREIRKLGKHLTYTGEVPPLIKLDTGTLQTKNVGMDSKGRIIPKKDARL